MNFSVGNMPDSLFVHHVSRGRLANSVVAISCNSICSNTLAGLILLEYSWAKLFRSVPLLSKRLLTLSMICHCVFVAL